MFSIGAGEKYQALEKSLAMTPEKIIGEVTASGLCGLGGAGFPSGKKWSAVHSAISDEKYVVVNADESEPGAFKDRYIIEKYPDKVVEGVLIAMRAVDASRAYIYIRHEYIDGHKKLKKALRSLPDHWKEKFGAKEILLFTGPGGYICGEESALLESIAGRRAEPQSRPPYPTQVGLFGKPTLVNNVETLANVPLIISLGAKKFRKSFRKLFSISGDVKKRGVYEAAPGVTLRELVFDHAEGMRRSAKFKLAIVGGASGRAYSRDDLDLKLDYGLFGNGAVIVLDESRNLKETARNIAEFFADECCGKCVPCRQGTAKFDVILKKIKNNKNSANEMEQLKLLSRVMKDTSLCGLGQTATNVFDDLVEKFEHEF